MLHRLIQEQLRYGNPTDARNLLAIQQQALRHGGNGGAGSPRSSSDSLSQEERQEPQGQEYHTDFQHSENFQLYHHHEQLPTYEQAKLNSQLFASQWCHEGQLCIEDSKLSHERSLERLMQLSLQCKDNVEVMNPSSSNSYPQIADYHNQHQHHNQPGFQSHTSMVIPHHNETLYARPPPPFHSQHNRIVPLMPTPEARHVYCSTPPAIKDGSEQMKLLIKENERLKQELEENIEKAGKIQKLEQEIKRISEAYDTLMQGCKKRETLEQTLRSKLMAEINRLQEVNTELRESLESSSKQALKDVEAADHNQHVIAKLLMQKEEQQLKSARMERQMQVLRQESAHAQAHTQQLQAELNRMNAYMGRVERLQGALAQLQATCEKRESLELRLRTRLEQELRLLRNQQRQSKSTTFPASAVTTSALLEQLREREERILALEADMTHWEQKYLEEKTMREFAMDAAATAAAQRDTTIINHSPCNSSKTSFSEDLPQAELRSQEVENRIRALYGQIVEKDAVINVLQQRIQNEHEKGESGEVVTSGASVSLTNSSPTAGKSGVDEQRANTSRLSQVIGAVWKIRRRVEPATRSPSTELGTQTDGPQQKPEDPLQDLDNVRPEAVEIFI